MKITDYPPWIQNAAKEIEKVAMMPANELAEIIQHWHEVCPHFIRPTQEDTAKALAHFNLDEPITKSWLIEQGGKADDNQLKVTFERGESLPLGFWQCDDGWKVHLLIAAHYSAQVVRGLKTRGDFRRIAAALLPERKDGE